MLNKVNKPQENGNQQKEKTVAEIAYELKLLNLQIEAIFEFSNIHARERRVLLERYSNQKDVLDEEKSRLLAICEKPLHELEVAEAKELC